MRSIILALAVIAATAVPAASQACRTHSYFINGKMVVCTICPYSTNCF